MDEQEALTQLRSLVVRGDGRGLVNRLSQEPWPPHPLQLIGDGLVAAVREGVEGAAGLAMTCAEKLSERDWEGDERLAQTLRAALGSGPTPMLRPLPVDLEELTTVLEGDPVQGGGRIDLATGEVWPDFVLDDAEEAGDGDEDDDDPDRWLPVDCEGSRSSYHDMVLFIDDLNDASFADRLSRAISGRGAFRRFKDRLSERPELLTRWFAFADDRQRGRARSWLAEEGYTPTRPPTGG